MYVYGTLEMIVVLTWNLATDVVGDEYEKNFENTEQIVESFKQANNNEAHYSLGNALDVRVQPVAWWQRRIIDRFVCRLVNR